MHSFVPAVTFTLLDWFWTFAFLALLVGYGVLFYRLGKRSEADFFLAGRRLLWWLPASSVYATHTATDTPLWVSGVIYQHGLRGLWYTFFAAWCAVSAFISTRIFRRSLAFSHAEWQSQRFGELMRGWVAGWQVFMNMFIAGWVGIAMGKVCEYLFDWPVWWGMVIFSSVCAIYTLAAWAGPHGVRVNAISPGGFRSREHKEPFLTQYCRRVLLERMAEHDDIKGVVVFLASEASRYLTGQNIIVDGGYSC